MVDQQQQEQEVEQQGIVPGWTHSTLIDAQHKRLESEINVAKCSSCPFKVKNEMKSYMKGKKIENILTTQQQQEHHDKISGQQSQREYSLPINVDNDEDDDDDDDPNPEFTATARANRHTYAEEDRRRGMGT
ncbi:hypothetical protein Taro_011483, partial [Colocasia esculenta]|nr:hypothetical protein [Colocasia esculenta]